jgi:hypothetical protein
MKLPESVHTSRPWRIHELTAGFRLEDVWELPTPGGSEDFPRLVQLVASSDPSHRSPSRAARALWAIRWKLGEVFGWDGPEASAAARVQTLRDRMPADLRDGPRGPGFDALPFTSLYLLENEFAAEIANRTMHGVMHLSWVEADAGGFRGQMAVYVKPNGLLGNSYMAAIRPFRHRVVYPPMMRQIARAWRGPDPVRQVDVPEEARALTTLSSVDYADCFLVDARSGGERSGEEWARATLEGAPPALRRNLRRGWAALGLKLDRGGSDRSVLGWALRHGDTDFALLAAGSRIGMPAELLFKPEGDTLLFATFVQQRNPVAKAIWAAVEPGHRRVVPHVLGRAARDGRSYL